MSTYDEAWDRIYGAGRQLIKYPWSDVVSFVFGYRPDKAPAQTAVLEVGCGAGPNIVFAAAEGFRVYGIDGSAEAVAVAQSRLAEKGLSADLAVGDFTRGLPYPDGSMDLVIDRAAITHANLDGITAVLREVRRVLKPGGRFLFTPFADSHSDFTTGPIDGQGTSNGLTGWHLGGYQVTFFSRKDIAMALREGWQLLSCVRREEVDMLGRGRVMAQWLVVAERVD